MTDADKADTVSNWRMPPSNPTRKSDLSAVQDSFRRPQVFEKKKWRRPISQAAPFVQKF
jgi:hypothetical protein